MKAMVLAAGLGTRLKPLTDSLPKALVRVGGVPMLERVLTRLAAAGVGEAVVNVHHHAEQVEAYLANRSAPPRTKISREDPVLETGGGLKHASWFFDDGRAFLVHNVDVVTDLDLKALYEAHLESGALATVAVQKRESSRAYLFSPEGNLVGRRDKGRDELAVPGEEPLEALAFTGVHAISPKLFERMTEEGAFSINTTYLRLAKEGALIRAFRCDSAYWADIGDAQKLARADAAARERGL